MADREIPSGPIIADVVCPHCGSSTKVNVPGWKDKLPYNTSQTPCGNEGCKRTIHVTRNASNNWEVKKLQQGCFVGDTRIFTPSGVRKIKDFRPGDLVWSWNLEKKQRVARRVQALKSYEPFSVVCITFKCGELINRIISTHNHPFLTQTGWRAGGKLRSGNILLYIDSQGDAVNADIQSVANAGREEVYNLRTEGEHNFIVDGCVAHNFVWFRSVRAAYYRYFVDSLTRTTVTADIAKVHDDCAIECT